MSAPRTYLKVGGKGRPNAAIPVREVEAVDCPDRDGPHWLINREGVTVCRGCGVEWATLDQLLNGRAS